MSRPLRIEYPGAWYHVMNRGRRYENIFIDQIDHILFVELLIEACELWNVNIAAFSLMPNHYHLLINTPLGNLSRFMRHVNGVYTQRFNREHNCDGQLFRGRYKAIVVDENCYLLHLVRYIHRNSVRAKLVKNIDDYKWCSHVGYISTSRDWDWIYKEFVLDMFSVERSKCVDPGAGYWEFPGRCPR